LCPDERESLFVAKRALDGTLLWSRCFVTESLRWVGDMVFDREANIVLSGNFMEFIELDDATTLGSGDGTDIILAKLDSDGTLLFGESFGGTNNDYGNALVIDEGNGILFGGNFSGGADFGGGPLQTLGENRYDAFLSSFDASGGYRWGISLGRETGSSSVSSLALDFNGDVVIIGSYEGLFGLGDEELPIGECGGMFLAKLRGI